MSEELDFESDAKWQPVMIYLRGGGRLECECGALAVIVIGKLSPKANDEFGGVDYWCQACYVKAQREEMERR